MIEGLKIRIPTDELVRHLSVRIIHHHEREAFYLQQRDTMKAGIPEGASYQFTNNNPIDDCERKAVHHRRRAELFTFISEHLVPAEIYELTENDLTRLEILSQAL